MDSDLQAKMDEFNEMTLRGTAITFSMEGISRDLKVLLARKFDFLAQVTESASSLAAVSRGSTKRSRSVDDLIEFLVAEIKDSSAVMNYIISRTLVREKALSVGDSEVEPDAEAEDDKKPPTKRSRKK
jgi:hypothetical protein